MSPALAASPAAARAWVGGNQACRILGPRWHRAKLYKAVALGLVEMQADRDGGHPRFRLSDVLKLADAPASSPAG